MKRTKTVRKKRKRKVVFQQKRESNAGIYLVTIVVGILLVVVKIRSAELNEILMNYESTKQQLLVEIEREEIRTEELIEEQKRVQTKQYAEKVAKDNLGLVYEDEIIFMLEE